MKPEEIRNLVEAIKLDGNDEDWHMREDSIWEMVLDMIATGNCGDPKACAAEALKSRQLDFCRWYA